MEYGTAAIHDMQKVKKLWTECFNDDKAFTDMWFDGIYKSRNTFVAKENRELFAAAQYLEYSLIVNDKTLKAAYVCGVGTKEQARGRGIGSRLMAFCEAELKCAGYDIIILISEADAFYEQLGYKKICAKKEYMQNCIPSFPDHKISAARGIDSDFMCSMYSAYAGKYSMYLLRDKYEAGRIAHLFDMYGGAYTVFCDDVPAAYVLLDDMGDRIVVEEEIYKTGSGRAAAEVFLSGLGKDIYIRAGEKEVCGGADARNVYAKELGAELITADSAYISPLI